MASAWLYDGFMGNGARISHDAHSLRCHILVPNSHVSLKERCLMCIDLTTPGAREKKAYEARSALRATF